MRFATSVPWDTDMRDLIEATIRQLSTLTPDQEFNPEAKLSVIGFKSSITLLKLQAALDRALGVKIGAITPSESLMSLISRVSGEKIDDRKEVSGARVDDTNISKSPNDHQPFDGCNVLLGTDIESVEALPAETLLRSDPFYEAHFLPEEIAYAALKPSARQTMAGILCAKESIRKCHPVLAKLDMRDIKISYEGDAPIVELQNFNLQKRFHLKISISHTDQFATATAIGFERMTE